MHVQGRIGIDTYKISMFASPWSAFGSNPEMWLCARFLQCMSIMTGVLAYGNFMREIKLLATTVSGF